MSKISVASRSIKVAAVLAVAAMLGASAGGIAQAEGAVPAWSSYDDQIAQADKEKAQQQQHAAELENAVNATDKAIADATLKLQQLTDQLPGVQEEYRVAQAAVRLGGAAAEDRREQADGGQGRGRGPHDADLRPTTPRSPTCATCSRRSRAPSIKALRTTHRSASSLVRPPPNNSSTTTPTGRRRPAFSQTPSTTSSSWRRSTATARRGRSAVKVYIDELKKQADALVVETQAASDAAAAKKAEVEKLLADTQDLKTYLDSQREHFLEQKAQADADTAALAAELDTLWKNKRAEEAVNGTGSLVKGFLSLPVTNPYITSPFGMRYHPIYHVWMLHAGTDFVSRSAERRSWRPPMAPWRGRRTTRAPATR